MDERVRWTDLTWGDIVTALREDPRHSRQQGRGAPTAPETPLPPPQGPKAADDEASPAPQRAV